MSTNRRRCQGGLCLLSLMALAGCFAKPMKLKTADAASEARQSNGGEAGGEAAPGDGPGPAVDSNMTTDGFSSSGGSSGSGGIGGKGGASTLDANANGGNSTGGISSNGSTGGGMAGSGGTGFDAASDLSPDGPAIDAPGTCSADRDCTSQAPLCLGNRCAKCAGDSDCAGRAGPACAASGLCVACTANKHCIGTASTCDPTTNQCVGCVARSDCAGACQSCVSGACAAVKGKDDPGFCAGTCDASGACKKKQGQACQTPADCAGGIACADGYCCDKACRGSCEACDVPSSLGTCTTLAANATPRADRTACAGSSPCKGSCNGTSASCTYPGVETTCVQPSCTGQTATLAASCAGDGTCTPATTKPCNGYGCSTTSPVCQTSCPVSGQILCNGSCVDVLTSPSHCGATCAVCGGATPKCVSGNCVQCATTADCTTGVCTNNTCVCSAPDPCPGKCGTVTDACGIPRSCTCTGTGQFCYSGTCSCRQSSPGNLLSNGGFETSLGISGWEADSYGIYHFVAWDSEDSEGCVGSGSLKDFQSSPAVYREPRRCLVMGPNQKVYFGAKFKTDPGTASFCEAAEMYDTACAVDQGTPGYRIGGGTSPSWTGSSTSFTTSADTQALYIQCTMQGKIDQVYMNLSVNSY
jgi:hypothetical protein